MAAAAQEEGINYVGMRNEQAASYAAQAYGYMTGRPRLYYCTARVWCTAWRIGERAAELLADDFNRGASRRIAAAWVHSKKSVKFTLPPFCKFAHGIESVERIPYYVEMATRHAIYGRPGACYLDFPDNIIGGECELDAISQVDRVSEPPRSIAPSENIEAALDLLEKAERPLALVGKGMAWAQAEDEVRAFIDRTQIPFVRSPMGKGVMPDEHPLAASAARTLALQQADVIFLMGARVNWIFHFGLPPRFAPDVKVIQLDIALRRSDTTSRPR